MDKFFRLGYADKPSGGAIRGSWSSNRSAIVCALIGDLINATRVYLRTAPDAVTAWLTFEKQTVHIQALINSSGDHRIDFLGQVWLLESTEDTERVASDHAIELERDTYRTGFYGVHE